MMTVFRGGTALFCAAVLVGTQSDAAVFELFCESEMIGFPVGYSPGDKAISVMDGRFYYQVVADDMHDTSRIITATMPGKAGTARLTLYPLPKLETWVDGLPPVTFDCYSRK